LSEPLIYTAKGNLPVASLKYETQWEDCADYTKFVETYTLDGEVVRSSAHVFGRRKLDIVPEQAQL
jgi:hypothetical protein